MTPNDLTRLLEMSRSRGWQPEFWEHAKTCPLPTNECQICKRGLAVRTWRPPASNRTESDYLSEAARQAQLELCELGLCIQTAPEQEWLVACIITQHVKDGELRADLAAAISERDEARAQLKRCLEDRKPL